MDLSEQNGIPDRPIDNFESHSITFLNFDDTDEYTPTKIDVSSDSNTLNFVDKELEEVQEQLLTYSQHKHPLTKQKCINMCSPAYPLQSILKIHIAKELEEYELLYTILTEIPANEKNGTILWETILYLHQKNIDSSQLIYSFIRTKEYPIEFRYYCLKSVIQPSFSVYFKEFITIVLSEKEEFQFVVYMLECLKQVGEDVYNYCNWLYQQYKEGWTIEQLADFADFCMSCEYTECIKLGTMLLQECGLTPELYKSKQSAHMVDVKTTYIHSLLDKVSCPSIDSTTIDDIEEKCTTEQQKIAIKRIRYDNRLYSGKTLCYIMTKLYWYIQTFEEYKREECMRILYEELEDMGRTCSLGHYVRLLNVLGGFLQTDIITVDPKEELRASFQHKLDKAIQSSPNVDQCLDAIYTQNEMDCMKYIYPLVNPIIDECVKEYKDILTREEIDEYTRTIIISYTLRG